MKYNRILLINPSYQPHWSRCEPTGLLQLAAYLENKGFTAEILDLNVEQTPNAHLKRLIHKYDPFVIGITALTCQADKAYALGKLIKKDFPSINLIYGGVHPTFMPEESFEKGCADFVVIGEGEETFHELARSIANDKPTRDILGIAYKSGKEIKKNPEREFLELEKLPIANYGKVPLKRYNTDIHMDEYENLLTVHMLTSRGCPNNCSYCASPALYKRQVRYQPIENIIEELKILKKKHNVHAIHFHDDNFMLDHKRILKLCKRIKQEKLNIKWNCLARVDTLTKHPEILLAMKESGCVGVELGVESGDERVYQKLNKKQHKENVKKAVKLLKENSLVPMYLMMSYCPGETIETPCKSARFLYELENGDFKGEKIPVFDFGSIKLMGHHARVSPGSEFFKIAEKEGILLAKKWGDHFEENINFVPYSLLKDIPIKNGNLQKEEVIRTLINNKKNILFFSKGIFYSTYKTIQNNFGTIRGFIKFMYRVYNECDGDRNVQDIADIFKKKKFSIEVVVSAISYLSILRLVRSKNG